MCKAKPNHDCSTSSGGFSLLHLARIKAAAAKDGANKPMCEDVNHTAERAVSRKAPKK